MDLPSSFMWLFYALVPLVAAQDSYDQTFVRPPTFGEAHDYTENDVWEWDTDQVLQWRTTWDEQNLKLYQNDNDNFWVVTPGNFQGSGSQTFPYNATFPAYLYNNSLPPIFFFRMNNVQDDSQAFNSHYFNISNVPASITAPLSIPTTTTTPTTTSTVATNSAESNIAPDQTPIPDITSVPQPPSGADDSSSGLSGGAIAGIVVGAVAGVALVAAIIAAFLYRRRNRRTPPAASQGHEYIRYGAAPKIELPADGSQSEAGDRCEPQRHELPS